MPPLLIREPDAVWVTVLTLLALQASFLVPPLGLAVMMARAVSVERVGHWAAVRALAPFLGVQVVVLGLTAAVPQLAHVAGDPTQARRSSDQGSARPRIVASVPRREDPQPAR